MSEIRIPYKPNKVIFLFGFPGAEIYNRELLTLQLLFRKHKIKSEVQVIC